jgi:type I restriction enzyme S subunit
LSEICGSQFYSYVVGSNYPAIGDSDIRNIRLILPTSEKEKTAIANILSKVDEAIASVQNSIASAERLKKSLMQNLLTGKMKPDGTIRTPEEFYIDEKFGKIPIGWEVKKIKECFKFRNGKGNTTPNLRYYPDDTYCIPVYGGNGITGYYHTALLYKPTILVGRVGEYCGNVFQTPDKSWVTDNAMLVSEVLMQEYDIDFFTLLLNSLNFKQLSDSTGQPKITQGSIGNIHFAYPPTLVEQKEIMYKINDLSNTIIQKQHKNDILVHLKKSLMQNLLTGRVKINEHSK